jgi:predicted DNA-binding transcriptional regulator YafY
MRADRLITLVLLLQRHGKLSASELAEELEVSERTIHRDIDALSSAGIPVYGEPGRGGGFALLDSYQTNLTGLTETEVQTFFALSIPAQLSELGIWKDLSALQIKLSRAMPSYGREGEDEIHQRLLIDSVWWHQSEEPIPHLLTVEQGVWQDRSMHITYRPFFAERLRRRVNPYGLVAKAGVWYLVCVQSKRNRVHRVDELLDVELADEKFERDPDFSLAAFWEDWCSRQEKVHASVAVTARFSPQLVPDLPKYFGRPILENIDHDGQIKSDGSIVLTTSFRSLVDARTRMLSFGNAVEVLEPLALRLSVADFARQIAGMYSKSLKDGESPHAIS